MPDLRERFATLSTTPVPDLWNEIDRRRRELDRATSVRVDREGVSLGSVGRRPGRPAGMFWRLSPAARVAIVLALVAALITGSFAVGAWWRGLPTVEAPLASAGPTRPVADAGPCAGMRGLEELVEVDSQSNETASWTPGTARGVPPGGQITTGALNALSNVGVFVVDPDRGEPCRIVDLRRAGLLPWELRWSPDGSSLAISSELWGGSGESHLLVWSDGAEPTFTRPWIGGELPAVAWSSDSGSLALVAGGAITILASDGGAPRVLTCPPCRAAARAIWSPDGSRIAIRTPAPDGPIGATELQVVDVAGGFIRPVDAGSDRVEPLAWIDATTILVLDSSLDQLVEVRTDAPGITVREGVTLPDGVALVISPTLRDAAFISDAQRADEALRVFDLATGTQSVLARSADVGAGRPIGDIAWSPDGETLAFTQIAGSDPDIGPLAGELWTVAVDGTGLRQLLRGPFDLFDGRHLGSGLEIGSWRPSE